MALRRELHRRGLRYRVEYPLPGLPRRRADVVFTRRRLAVFVDGCFWHVCPIHCSWPSNNASWWTDKLRANVRRDRETEAHLLMIGWRFVRLWEHDPTLEAADSVEAALVELTECGRLPKDSPA